MDVTYGFFILFFSSVGLAYFVYGKKQASPVPLICGLLLMLYPYFVSSTLLVVGLGVALSVIPYFVRL